ncbi:MAG: hypothetical protein JWQ81_5281 [Amycolatopsis sp.]|jgi:hypothetical protein|uniref:FHA domain-containing protein n=1 Tax=Amycolatopsis sp. TaxID=37632 RepID=UPI00260712A3|nr:FHA domain-containing protein [Amycolatopsis sp.]MCU1684542.1 hypothetical protein [Amycolatopsis sp.]
MQQSRVDDGGRALPPSHGSLAFGVPPSAPGTIYVLGIAGGFVVAPREGRTILFGRNRPDVHVCVGEDDRKVSRVHGIVIRREGRWWMRTTGKRPIRLPGSMELHPESEPVPLAEGYTAVFVRGSGQREHLLEFYVAGSDGQRPVLRTYDETDPPQVWRLSPDERLALVALAQRYLLQESYPQPLTWRQVAHQLSELQPDGRWTVKRVEHVVVPVRARLSRAGVSGLMREEVGEPVGNTLNDNLIRELMLSNSLVPPDLALLDRPDEG